MSEHDVLRWGDTQTVAFQAGALTTETAAALATVQMLKLHWQRPLLWKVLVSVVPTIDASETEDFNLRVTFTLGCGGAMADVPIDIAITAASGYAPIVQFFELPAQDVLAKSVLTGLGLSTAVAASSVQITILGAPFTEPRGIVDIRDIIRESMGRGMPMPSRTDPDYEQNPRWMPEGFDDGELRYRK